LMLVCGCACTPPTCLWVWGIICLDASVWVCKCTSWYVACWPIPLYMHQQYFSNHPADPSFAMCFICQPVPALQASTNFLLIWPTLVLPCLSPVGLSQLYMHQQIFYSSGQPQVCHISCWPVPVLHVSTNFLLIWPTLVLSCVSPVSLSHLYMHQQIFYSSSQP